MPDKHTLLVTDITGKTFKGLTYDSYQEALDAWSREDDQRRAGRRPHIQHYEVRSADDPRVINAPQSYASHWCNVVSARGLGDRSRLAMYNAQDRAARQAFKLWWGSKRNDGQSQGLGGWFYTPDGQPVAQGLRDLAGFVARKHWTFKLPNGRWVVTDPSTAYDSAKKPLDS